MDKAQRLEKQYHFQVFNRLPVKIRMMLSV